MIVLPQLDHLVYASSNLEKGIQEIESLTGAKVSPGGVHPGRGTHNAILSLGPYCYLEIIAPDPAQANTSKNLWMGLTDLKGSRITRWAVKSSNLQEIKKKMRQADINIGDLQQGQRRLPSGPLLKWELSDPEACEQDGLIPFFIDWLDSIHPATPLPQSCKLLELSIQHPQADQIAEKLKQVGIAIKSKNQQTAKICARLQTPHGIVSLQ